MISIFIFFQLFKIVSYEYPSLPHTRPFNTSLQNVTFTRRLLLLIPQNPLLPHITSTQIRHFHTNLWLLHVSSTPKSQKTQKWIVVSKWRVEVTDLCGSAGSRGLKRSGPCVEVTMIFLVPARRLQNLPIWLKWRDWVTSVITDDARWFSG